jgi:ABC-2 type transport system ATP-binding protein
MSLPSDSRRAMEKSPGGKNALVARALVKSYPGASRPALNDLHLCVAEGEIFGLLGPNGAGKTTAISIMCTLLRPASGTLTICGVDVLRRPARARRLIGLVPQEIALYPSLTARENLRYFGRLHGMGGRRLNRRIEECLAHVGLEDRGDQRVETYSGGMKRRANLAVGIIHEPKILFLDEPTVGIDAQSRSTILENLASLNREGMTMVYTTHYMEEAQQLCSTVAVVDAGEVVAEGAPSRMIADSPGCSNLEELFLHLTGKHLRD